MLSEKVHEENLILSALGLVLSEGIDRSKHESSWKNVILIQARMNFHTKISKVNKQLILLKKSQNIQGKSYHEWHLRKSTDSRFKSLNTLLKLSATKYKISIVNVKKERKDKLKNTSKEHDSIKGLQSPKINIEN